MSSVRKILFTVTVDLPGTATVEEMRAYIETEVRAGSGGRSPEDPLFYLDKESVEVRYIGKVEKHLRRTL